MKVGANGFVRAARKAGQAAKACGRAWALAAAALAFAVVQGGAISWFLVYTALLLAAYGTALALVGFASVRVRRAATEVTGTAGERLELVLEVDRGWFPLPYLQVEDGWPEAWRRRGDPVGLLLPGLRRRMTLSLGLERVPRGEVRLATVTLRTGDWFGLVRMERTVALPATVRVYPRVWTCAAWPFGSGGTRYGMPRIRAAQEDVTTVAGVRAYHPGDSPSRVHWKLTAHRGQLFTKTFDARADGKDVVVVLNRTVYDYGSHGEARFEQAVSAVASVAVAARSADRDVALIAEPPDAAWIMPRHEATAYRRLLDHLLTVAADVTSPFAHTLQALERRPSAAVIVVTPRLDGDAVDALRRMAAGGPVVAVCWIPPVDADDDGTEAAEGMPGAVTGSEGLSPAALAALSAAGVVVYRATARGLVRVGGGETYGGS